MRFVRLSVSVSLIAIFSAAASPCLAEPPQNRGRLNDGRAFRIENGMRLTDYIAELEVTNDDLKRQLYALEQELDEKSAKLERSGAASPALREKDLVSGRGLPKAQTIVAADCSVKIQPLESKISSLEHQLQLSQRTKACNYNTADNPLWAEVSSLREQLAARPKSEQVTTANAKAEREQEARIWAEEESEKLKSGLAASQTEIASLKSRLEQAQDELNSARATAREAASAKDSALQARAALAPAAPEKSVEAKVLPQLETSAPEPIANVEEARSALKKELASIQTLVNERKSLLDSVKARGKGISISLRGLVTRQGKSLDMVRVEVNKLNSESNVPEIRSGLSEITAILNDDIGVLKRLAR